MSRIQITILVPMILGSLIPCASGAEVTSAYRIIGFCSPDRQEDFRKVMSELPEMQLVGFDYDKAEATFRYEHAAIFPNGKVPKNVTPEQVMQQVNNLLRRTSKNTFTVAAPSTVPAEQLAQLEIKVGLLDCKGCRYTAYLAIATLAGVERATVNSETGTLTAWIDPAKTNRAALIEALKKAQVPLPEQP